MFEYYASNCCFAMLLFHFQQSFLAMFKLIRIFTIIVGVFIIKTQRWSLKVFLCPTTPRGKDIFKTVRECLGQIGRCRNRKEGEESWIMTHDVQEGPKRRKVRSSWALLIRTNKWPPSSCGSKGLAQVRPVPVDISKEKLVNIRINLWSTKPTAGERADFDWNRQSENHIYAAKKPVALLYLKNEGYASQDCLLPALVLSYKRSA